MSESLFKLNLKAEKINQKSILITGGTGSFGKKLLRTLLDNFKPTKIVIFSRDEFKQSEMKKLFSPTTYPNIRYFVGDIRDLDRLKEAFGQIDIIFHAAALKQVPVIEYNPMEAVKTNILGAENVIKAAIYCNVESVIAISTDKSVNPVNLYGATKLCFEKLFIHANIRTKKTKFLVARYGNVFASRGSVVNIFKEQMAQNKPFTITDERMTRFTMTLEEAVHFVLNCFEVSWGGEIFVPKLPSYQIKQLTKLMDKNRTINIIGIRPGEKIHELMISRDESHNCHEFDNYYIIRSLETHEIQHFDLTKYQTDHQKCPNGFEYSSGSNQLISDERLEYLIKTLT